MLRHGRCPPTTSDCVKMPMKVWFPVGGRDRDRKVLHLRSLSFSAEAPPFQSGFGFDGYLIEADNIPSPRNPSKWPMDCLLPVPRFFPGRIQTNHPMHYSGPK